ncbi:hypothetical protein MVI01_34540 [Myxococcus virescens]|uniref:Uncharacterized protein n=1 Tax=Myxococcus virescens TaxID=83456 RepID=A0A511HDQ2_9BACT|nr:hypothetical protein MVI01_34540 [Myxococcus virescens]
MHGDIDHDHAVRRDLGSIEQRHDEVDLARGLLAGARHQSAYAGEGHGLRVTEAALDPSQRLDRGAHERQLRMGHRTLGADAHHEVRQLLAGVDPDSARGKDRRFLGQVVPGNQGRGGALFRWLGLDLQDCVRGELLAQWHANVERDCAREVLIDHHVSHVHQRASRRRCRLHGDPKLTDIPLDGHAQVDGGRSRSKGGQRKHRGHARLRMGVSRANKSGHQRDERQAPLQVIQEHSSPSNPTKTTRGQSRPRLTPTTTNASVLRHRIGAR